MEIRRSGLREMTRAAKITYSLALLIGLASGAVMGFWFSSSTLRLFDLVGPIFSPAALGNYSYLQYKYADAEHARTALQSYADFLDQMEKIKPDRAQRADLSFTYARLALLEESQNNLDQSRILMTKARSYMSNSGREISEADLRKALNIMDDRNPH
jgi:hypothetical protein